MYTLCNNRSSFPHFKRVKTMFRFQKTWSESDILHRFHFSLNVNYWRCRLTKMAHQGIKFLNYTIFWDTKTVQTQQAGSRLLHMLVNLYQTTRRYFAEDITLHSTAVRISNLKLWLLYAMLRFSKEAPFTRSASRDWRQGSVRRSSIFPVGRGPRILVRHAAGNISYQLYAYVKRVLQ
jgi:hypothetical protein